MTDKELVKAIKTLTNGTWVSRFHSATCLGYLPMYDKNGREISYDPNYYTCEANIAGTTYHWVKHLDKVYIKRDGKYLSYLSIMDKDLTDVIVKTI